MGIPEDVLTQMLREADAAPPDALASIAATTLVNGGVRGAVLYLADYDQRLLLPAPGSVSCMSAPEPTRVQGSPAGSAYRLQQVVEDHDERIVRMWTPVSQRGDCLGVLELEIEPQSVDEGLRRLCRDLGVLLGHLLLTAHQYTDAYELISRRRDMNLPAEMHWEIQPPMNHAAPGVVIAGGIEPAYEVGGDAFDYNVNQGILDFALLDAMGHGLEAALLSIQAVAAYRFARRRQQTLAEVGDTLDTTFIEQFGGERFVTGLLCRLDCHTGVFRWVNAAHLSPLLMRKGKVVEELESTPRCPLGLDIGDRFEINEEPLNAGDSVILYSDGVIDARAPGGEEFEVEQLCSILEQEMEKQGSPAAMVHSVIDEVKQHSAGPLRDDATLVALRYVGA